MLLCCKYTVHSGNVLTCHVQRGPNDLWDTVPSLTVQETKFDNNSLEFVILAASQLGLREHISEYLPEVKYDSHIVWRTHTTSVVAKTTEFFVRCYTKWCNNVRIQHKHLPSAPERREEVETCWGGFAVEKITSPTLSFSISIQAKECGISFETVMITQ